MSPGFCAGSGAAFAAQDRRLPNIVPPQAGIRQNVGDAGVAGVGRAPAVRNLDRDPNVRSFILHWGLDEATSMQLLESLPERVCSTVIAEFEPRGDTRNVNAKLRGFANTVLNGSGPGNTPTGNQLRGQGAGFPGMSTPSSGIGADELGFLRMWGLAEDDTARDVLARLTPAVRARVMAEFAPGSNTQNVLGKFVGFANSVSRAQANNAAASGPAFRPASHSVAPGGFSRAHVSRSTAHTDAASMLATKFGLGDDSVLEFRAAPVEIQAVVAAEFDPKGAVHNIDGKFCAFLRSVASRAPRGSKRPGQYFDQPGAMRQRF